MRINKGIWHSIQGEYWFRVADQESNHDFELRVKSLRSSLADSNSQMEMWFGKILKRTEMSQVISEKAQRQCRDFYFHFCESVDPWTFEKCLQVNHLSLTAAFTSFSARLNINHCGFEAHFPSPATANLSSKGFRVSVRNISRLLCTFLLVNWVEEF